MDSNELNAIRIMAKAMARARELHASGLAESKGELTDALESRYESALGAYIGNPHLWIDAIVELTYDS